MFESEKEQGMRYSKCLSLSLSYSLAKSFQSVVTPAPELPHTAEIGTAELTSRPIRSDRSLRRSSTHADNSSGVRRSAFVSTIWGAMMVVMVR